MKRSPPTFPLSGGMSYSYTSQPPWLFNGRCGRVHMNMNLRSLVLPTRFTPFALVFTNKGRLPLSLTLYTQHFTPLRSVLPRDSVHFVSTYRTVTGVPLTDVTPQCAAWRLQAVGPGSALPNI